jgi:hypothetical protein
LDGIAKQHGLNLVIIDNEDPAIAENELVTAELLEKYMSEDVALVTLEVIQYRSGARSDIESITDLARSYGALVVWDASHAAGAIEMNFDQHGVVHISMEIQAPVHQPGSMLIRRFRESCRHQFRVGLQMKINSEWVRTLLRQTVSAVSKSLAHRLSVFAVYRLHMK